MVSGWSNSSASSPVESAPTRVAKSLFRLKVIPIRTDSEEFRLPVGPMPLAVIAPVSPGASMIGPPADQTLARVKGTLPNVRFSRSILTDRIFVFKNEAFIISQNDTVFRDRDEVVRSDWDLASPAGGVDHKLRDRKSCSVPPKTLDDLDALPQGGPKMLRPLHGIALVEVVGPDPNFKEAVAKLFHHRHAVIHPFEKHALIIHRNPGPLEPVTGLGGFPGNFPGVVEMGIDPKRPVS